MWRRRGKVSPIKGEDTSHPSPSHHSPSPSHHSPHPLTLTSLPFTPLPLSPLPLTPLPFTPSPHTLPSHPPPSHPPLTPSLFSTVSGGLYTSFLNWSTCVSPITIRSVDRSVGSVTRGRVCYKGACLLQGGMPVGSVLPPGIDSHKPLPPPPIFDLIW